MSSRSLHRSVIGAMHAATWRHGRHNGLNAVYQTGAVRVDRGLTITMASRHAPYAVSTHGLGGARHQVRAVFFAWHRGKVVGILVWTWCGSKLITAELTDTDALGRYDCSRCDITVPRISRRLAVTVTVEEVA